MGETPGSHAHLLNTTRKMLPVKRGGFNSISESQGFRQHSGLPHGRPQDAKPPWGQVGAGPVLPLRPGPCLCLHGLRPFMPALHTLGWLWLEGPGGQGPALRGHTLDHPRVLPLTLLGQNRVTHPPQQW